MADYSAYAEGVDDGDTCTPTVTEHKLRRKDIRSVVCDACSYPTPAHLMSKVRCDGAFMRFCPECYSGYRMYIR